MVEAAVLTTKLPPGPKVNPIDLVKELIVGDPQIVTNPLAYFRKLHNDYGDLVYSDFGIGRYYFTDNTALIRKIFVSEPRAYAKADAYKEAALFLGKGILNSEGEFWQAQRGMVQPAFQKSRLHAFARSMAATSDAALRDMDVREPALPGTASSRGLANLKSEVDVSALSMHIALENICKFLFGSDFAANEKVIREAVHFGNDFISRRIQAPVKLPIYIPAIKNLRFMYYRFVLDQILYRIIDQRLVERDAPQRDLLGMLLTAEKAYGHGKVRKEQVRDEILTLLIAGHETTGFTLAMALWVLAKYPQIQEKLRDELTEKLSDGADINPEELENCTYLEAVVNETLRLYPAAWIIGRRTVADEDFEGYLLKKNSELQICILALHRNAKYWSEPDTFKPERFLSETPEPSAKQAYMPFGAGPRRCIGNIFALMEMQIGIAKILMRYRLKITNTVEPEIEYLFTARLKNPLPVRFESL
jgi:cytochrome P450